MSLPTAPPSITADSATVVAIEGNTVSLLCNATGDPIPIQTWFRNGNELMGGGRYQISTDGRVLTVQGWYLCVEKFHRNRTSSYHASIVIVNNCNFVFIVVIDYKTTNNKQ